MFQKMLTELDEMETEFLINHKETKVKLEVEKQSKYEQFLLISMNININLKPKKILKNIKN